MIHKILKAGLTITAALTLSTASYAQSLDNAALQLIRLPSNTSNEITLRISTKEEILGCAVSNGINTTTTVNQYAMDIHVDGYSLRPPEDGENCQSGTPLIKADIILNKQQIQDNEIKKIVIHDGATLDIFNIVIKGTEFTLAPRGNPILFKQRDWDLGGRDPMKNFFLERDAIMLYLKKYPHVNIQTAITEFAKQNKLVQTKFLETQPAASDLRNEMLFPFRDISGRFVKILNQPGEHKVGSFAIHNDRSGPFRAWPETSTFDVYMKKP